MIKAFLLNILRDPISNKSLLYNEEKNILCADENKYTINKNIPIILSNRKPQNLNIASQLHKDYNTTFDYVEHYENDAAYFNYFEKENKVTKNERQKKRDGIIKKIPIEAKLILDVGCGSGWVSSYFTPKKVNVISMDIALKNPLQCLQQNNNEYHAGLVADVLQLPIKDNSVDVIIASEIIEHVIDPSLFITKLFAAIKVGGKLIIGTPYNEKLVYNMCVHCNKPTPANGHLHSFNEQNIQQYLPTNATVILKKFNNKYFTRLRIYDVINFLPFNIWIAIDALVNKFLPKESAFLIEIIKKN